MNYVSSILACPVKGPSMGWMTRHQATPQRLEPVGQDRDYGASVGPDQPRYQLTRLTRTTTSPTTVLICLSTEPLTSPESIWNRVISGGDGSRGADLGSVLNGHRSECDVTSIICRCSHYYTALVRTLYKGLPCGKREIANFTMVILNTLHDTPTSSPVGDGSTDSQSDTYH